MYDFAEISRTWRWLLAVLWCFMFAAVVWALRMQNRFFALEGKPIGQLMNSAGSVQVRSEDVLAWHEAQARHNFFEGDRVATGRGSTARITLNGGREIMLSEESQIVMSAIQQGSDFNYVVELVRGSVEGRTKNSNSKSLPMTIRSGRKTLTVENGKNLALTKADDGTTSVIAELPKAPTSVAEVKQMAVSASLIAFANEPAPSPTPSPAPTAIPKRPPPPKIVKAPELPPVVQQLPNVATPKADAVYWSLAPLQSVGKLPLRFRLEPPQVDAKDKPLDASWNPLIQITSKSNQKLLLKGSGPKLQEIVTTVEEVRNATQPESTFGVPTVMVEYFPGNSIVVPGKSGEIKEFYSKAPRKFQIIGIGDGAANSVTLALDKLATGDSTGSDVISAKSNSSVYKYEITLLNGKDLTKLIPFIRGASSAALKRGRDPKDEGIFIVRGQDVVAQLSGSGVRTPGSLKSLLTAIDGDFVFSGSRNALFNPEMRNGRSLRDAVNEALDQGKVLYVAQRKSLIEVNKEFVRKNKAVANFIASNAPTIFLSNVEILENR